jgi:hypothetical protein
LQKLALFLSKVSKALALACGRWGDSAWVWLLDLWL